MKRCLTLATCLALTVGCQKSGSKPEQAEKAKESPAAGASGEKSAQKANLPPLDNVPTEEDFVEAVEKEITDDTDLEKELDALEKEISG